MTTLVHAGEETFFMVWATLWALVLGYVLSGVVQAFVSPDRVESLLGDRSPRSLGRATVFGALSSSCSYAAAAVAKTLFGRGADFTTSIVFMVASTNLVIELGLVLWLLIGWQFALAEVVGGLIMIALLAALVPRLVRADQLTAARRRLEGGDGVGSTHCHDHAPAAGQQSASWHDAARYTLADLRMVWQELALGFVIAGVLATTVPVGAWHSIFASGHGVWSTLEQVAVGPLLAVLSFVCSVGNVPLAAALWGGGIGFGGVIAFVFADLITLPLLAIYRRYYGGSVTLRLLAAMWISMSAAGLSVEALFRAVGIPAPARHRLPVHIGFAWNATTVLDLVGIVVLIVVVWTARRRDATPPLDRTPSAPAEGTVHADAPPVREGVPS